MSGESQTEPAQHLLGMAGHMLTALAGIKQLPQDIGTLACPACGGTLRWAKLGPKKHVHAKCETTPHCLVFLE
jgi:hypothetical protein